MRRTRFFFGCLALTIMLAANGSPLQAQSPGTPALQAKFLQGVKKEVPEDFFAELQESRLRLKLQNFGVHGAEQGLEQALVTLITPSGRREPVQSDSQGNVEFDDVDEGVVGVVVTGPDMHASVAVFAKDKTLDANDPFDEDAVAQDAPAPRSSPFRLPVMRVSSSEVLKNTDAYTLGAPSKDFSSAEYAGFQRYETKPTLFYRVRMQADGVVPGRVFSIVDPNVSIDYTGTNVTIYKEGEYYRSTTMNATGLFEFDEMTTGIYGVIAAGPVGYAAFAFEVMAADDAGADLPIPRVSRNSSTSVFRTAGFLAQTEPGGVSDSLGVPLLPPAMLGELRQIVRDAFQPMVSSDVAFDSGVPPMSPAAPFGGGAPAAGGAGAGAGGGGGALGGGGGLLGIAGLAAGLAAVSDNNDDFVAPPPISPFVPVVPTIPTIPTNPTTPPIDSEL